MCEPILAQMQGVDGIGMMKLSVQYTTNVLMNNMSFVGDRGGQELAKFDHSRQLLAPANHCRRSIGKFRVLTGA